jgi:YVTN family beta-propeller protein
MYVPNSASGDVSVVDTNFVNPTVTIPGITSALGIAYDPVNQQMYVSKGVNAPSEVDVIDTNTNTLVPPAIPVGNSPIGIAYEPLNGRMYVANSGSDSVTVIQTPGFGGTATANIDSATDGDGVNLNDGDTTTSDEITFAFSGTGAASFECSLDYSTFEACTSGQSYSGLASVEHTFDVRALDNNGDRQAPPTRFTWTVQEAVDPATAIEELIMDVRTLDGVNFLTKIVLNSQLRLALFYVNIGTDFLACGTMNSFINTVNFYESRGRLTGMQADDLIQQAQAIQDAIGCGVGNTLNAQEADAADASLDTSEMKADTAAEDTTITTTSQPPQSSTADSPDNPPFSISLPS